AVRSGRLRRPERPPRPAEAPADRARGGAPDRRAEPFRDHLRHREDRHRDDKLNVVFHPSYISAKSVRSEGEGGSEQAIPNALRGAHAGAKRPIEMYGRHEKSSKGGGTSATRPATPARIVHASAHRCVLVDSSVREGRTGRRDLRPRHGQSSAPCV